MFACQITIINRGSYLAEHRLLDHKGKPAGFFRVGARLLYNPQNKFEGVVIMASPLTPREPIEQTLVDNEAYLRRILDDSPIPLFVIDPEHRLIYWNHACEGTSKNLVMRK